MDINNDTGQAAGFSLPATAHFTAFVLLFANLILSPWLYGSWEMWWFWPMFTLLVAAGFFSGAGALVESVFPDRKMSVMTDRFRCSRKIVALGLAAAPFLIYAVLRAQFPSGEDRPLVVYPAEKSLILMFSPLLIAFVSFFSLNRRRLRILCYAILANILAIAVYAAVMHLRYAIEDPSLSTPARKVGLDLILWTRCPWYFGRAKGTFYCPNHLAAFINIGICFLVAVAFTPAGKRGSAPVLRIAAAVLALALFFPHFLTQSRGGMLSLLLTFAIGIPLFAMRGYKRLLRVGIPVVAIVLLVTAGSIMLEHTKVGERFKGFSLYKLVFEKPKDPSNPGDFRKEFHDAFWYGFDRGIFIGSALRAWESNPVWGIGPGQHEHRWPEFDPTPYDRNGEPVVRPVNGDFSAMRRPRLVGNSHFLYEVHSDWVQLLEEYGIVGFWLFLIPVGLLGVFLWNSQTLTLRKAADNPPIAAASAAADTSQTQSATDPDDTDDEDDERSSRHRRRSRHHRTRDEFPWRKRERVSALELSLPLAATLAALVLAIHSFTDFSLQMPSITWVLSFIISAGILTATRTHR